MIPSVDESITGFTWVALTDTMLKHAGTVSGPTNVGLVAVDTTLFTVPGTTTDKIGNRSPLPHGLAVPSATGTPSMPPTCLDKLPQKLN